MEVRGKIRPFGAFDRIKGMQPLFSKNYPYLSKVLGEERKTILSRSMRAIFKMIF